MMRVSTFVVAGGYSHVGLYEVKELLGHASLAMTERYSHLSPDRNRRAADTMGAIFQNADPEQIKIMNSRQIGAI